MTRASGRRGGTQRQPVPGSPEGDDIGLSIRQDPGGSPIPGLTGNISNYETVRQQPAAQQPGEALDEYRGIMAHGVPNDSHTTSERAQAERGPHRPPRPPTYARPAVRPVPVPVYVVSEGGAPDVYITASPRNITVPSTASDPVRLCGRNPKRNRILLLNEDTATNVRFAVMPQNLVNGGGALLPWPVNSYLVLETQDELYACTVSATLSVIVSVIEEFDQEL